MTTATSTSSATARSSMVGPRAIRVRSSSAATPITPTQKTRTTFMASPPGWGWCRRPAVAGELRCWVSAPRARTTRRSRASTCRASRRPRLVAGIEDVEEQGVSGASRLDDQAAGNQRDHLGDDGEDEVGPGAQVHLDHGVAWLAMQLQRRPRDLGAGDDDVGEEVDDEPAQPQRTDVQVHAQRRQGEHQADHERDQEAAEDVGEGQRRQPAPPTPRSARPAAASCRLRNLPARRLSTCPAHRRALRQDRGDVEVAIEEVVRGASGVVEEWSGDDGEGQAGGDQGAGGADHGARRPGVEARPGR